MVVGQTLKLCGFGGIMGGFVGLGGNLAGSFLRDRVVEGVVFIDPGVDDIATILGGLRDGLAAVLLDDGAPVVDQILATLDRRPGTETVDIIAHGAPGRVRFAAGDWTAASVAAQAEKFSDIGAALGDEGRLGLWSCRAGAGSAGAALVAALGAASGLDVAASKHLVGAAALGGTWALAGAAVPPLSDAGVAAYAGVLATITSDGTPTTLYGSYTGLVPGELYYIEIADSSGTAC